MASAFCNLPIHTPHTRPASLLAMPVSTLAWLTPSRTDASVRLTNSALALVALGTLTALLPVPSPARALLPVALRRDVPAPVWAFSVLRARLRVFMCGAC
jgi:hypothetical protein